MLFRLGCLVEWNYLDKQSQKSAVRVLSREREDMEDLSEEERRALRGSKFAPLPPLSSSSSSSSFRAQPPPPRLAHPGGPLMTNKAAALAKFLERKLQDPNGLASINPDLLEVAVKNAKDTVSSSSASNSGRNIRHVTSFGDHEDFLEEGRVETFSSKKQKRKKKKRDKKNKKQKVVDDSDVIKLKKPKKKKLL